MKVELCYKIVATVQVEVDDKFKALKDAVLWTPEYQDLAIELEDILSEATNTDVVHFYSIFDAEDDAIMLEY